MTTLSTTPKTAAAFKKHGMTLLCVAVFLGAFYVFGEGINKQLDVALEATELSTKGKMSLILVNVEYYDKILNESSGASEVERHATEALMVNLMMLRAFELLPIKSGYKSLLDGALEKRGEIAERLNLAHLSDISLKGEDRRIKSIADSIYELHVKPAYANLPDNFEPRKSVEGSNEDAGQIAESSPEKEKYTPSFRERALLGFLRLHSLIFYFK